MKNYCEQRPNAQAQAASNPRRGRHRRGMGLVELLIAMSIVTGLLTATAVAVHAAFKAYEVNQQQATLLSKARVSLAFITGQVRTTKLHAPDSTIKRASFSTGLTVVDDGLVMYDADDDLLRFHYDKVNKKLLVITPKGTYTMASGVESFSVTLEPMRSANSIKTGGGWDLLKRATIQLTVRAAGDETVTLSGSVMPRRNAW